MRQLDSETADRDLTSSVAVLTHAPDAGNPCLCQALVFLGDGSKDLDGTGGDFEVTVTIGSQTLEPSPQTVTCSTAARTCLFTSEFPVPANTAVVIRVKSPNAADTDVATTAYLYDVGPLQPSSRGRSLGVEVSGNASGIDEIKSKTGGLNFDGDDVKATLGGETVTVGDLTAAALALFLTTDTGETTAADRSVGKVSQGAAGNGISESTTVDGVPILDALKVIMACLLNETVVAADNGSVEFKDRAGTSTVLTITYGTQRGERTSSVIS